MFISIIIPCYNAEKWIGETLENVFSQHGNYQIEVIVVNDGSTDNSEKIIKTNFPNVILITTENMGASNARNIGFNISKGDYIQFLDADDLLADKKLELQLKLLKETGSHISYGNWQYLNESDLGNFKKGEIVKRQMDNPEIDLFTSFWCPPAVYLFKREIVERVGGWHNNLPIIQDARFVLDCAIKGAKFSYTNQIVAFYRNSKSNSLSKDNDNFIVDCYNNATEIEKIWLDKGKLTEQMYLAISENYEFITRVSYKNNKELYKKAYDKLLEYGITDKMIKKNTSKNFYLLNKLLGYENALYLHSKIKKIKNINYLSK